MPVLRLAFMAHGVCPLACADNVIRRAVVDARVFVQEKRLRWPPHNVECRDFAGA